MSDLGGIEQDLTTIYGEQETDEKIEHRQRVVSADGTINAFQRTALAGRARRERSEQAQKGPDQLDPGVAPIPEVAPEFQGDVPEPIEGYEDRVDLVKEIKGRVNIATAVQRWGKPQANLKIGNRREGIHVRCPFPSHADHNPSAWINLDKNTWFCGACQEGGDQIDFFAAARHGLSPQDFHAGKQFREILEEAAGELGIDFEPPPKLPPHLQEPPDDPPMTVPTPEPDPEPTPSLVAAEPVTSERSDEGTESVITVEQMTEGIDLDSLDWDTQDSDDPLRTNKTPTYDWRNLSLPSGTFLHEWMVVNERDLGWIPPEYFMMLGLQAIGIACGHHQYSTIRGLYTTGSLVLTIVGPSGVGKSTAASRMTQMFNQVVGARWDPELGSGVRIFNTPASAEALIKAIRHEIPDPMDPTMREETRTTAFMFDNEFATFVSKTKRRGGEHMKQRVIELYDFTKYDPDRKELVTSDNSVTNGVNLLHDAFFSATFCTQTDVLRRQVEDHDMLSGFMNRILPVFGMPLREEDPDDEIDHRPSYVEFYSNLWNRLRALPLMTILPVSDAAKNFLRTDPYMRTLISFGTTEDLSILARLKQHMHRIAFLLAVNDQSREVGVGHYETALHLTKNYLQKCYGQFFSAAKATQTKDISDKFVSWLHGYYDRSGEWPTWSDMIRQRFWRMATEAERDIALKSLQLNHAVARLKLVGGKRATPILVATDRDDIWGRSYAGVWDKSYEKESFYASNG